MLLCAQCHVETRNHSTCDVCGESSLLDDRYRLERVIGQGAQGVSFLGYRDGDSEPLAIKEFALTRAASWKALEQFEREASTLKRIDHPNVPKFVDSFSLSNGRWVAFYLVRAFVEGEDLRSLGEVDVYNAFTIGQKLLKILADLHERPIPIVHRDIKPANVILRPDGELSLVDFGSARKDETVGSTIAGTFGYMAPEQLAGIATPASDVYGVGAVIASLLAGRDASELLSHNALDVQHLEIPYALRSALEAMTSPEPSVRPTAREAASAIRASLRDDSTALAQVDVTTLPGVQATSEGLMELRRRSHASALLAVMFLPLLFGVLMGSFVLGAITSFGWGGLLMGLGAIPLALLGRAINTEHRDANAAYDAIANGPRVLATIQSARRVYVGLEAPGKIVYTYEFTIPRPWLRRPVTYTGQFKSYDLALLGAATPIVAFDPANPKRNVVVGWHRPHGARSRDLLRLRT